MIKTLFTCKKIIKLIYIHYTNIRIFKYFDVYLQAYSIYNIYNRSKYLVLFLNAYSI